MNDDVALTTLYCPTLILLEPLNVVLLGPIANVAVEPPSSKVNDANPERLAAAVKLIGLLLGLVPVRPIYESVVLSAAKYWAVN